MRLSLFNPRQILARMKALLFMKNCWKGWCKDLKPIVTNALPCRTIARACPSHPALAMMLSANLYHYIDRLLYICGDTEQSFRRMARIKGVCAVAVKAGVNWQRDDSPDLSRTMKVLDRDLKTAAEWAVSLRLLSIQEGGAEEDDHL